MKFSLKPLHAAILIVGLSPLTAQAVVAPIAADTHLAATNAGTAVAVNILPAGKGLLKFDLSTLPNGITSGDVAKATLVFFVKTVTTGGQLQASPVTGTWDESTVTSSPSPTIGAPMATSAPISRSNSYFALDVTHLVLDWVDNPTNNNGLVLEPSSSTPTTALTLDSKEAIQTSHPAYIEITLNGPAGAKGAKGDTGAQGLQGIQGLKGNAGATGAQGEKGFQGPKGLQGDQGLQGPIGFTGSQGERGVQGFQGVQGATGPQSMSSALYRSQRTYVLDADSTVRLYEFCPIDYPNLLSGGCGHRDYNDVANDITVNYSGPDQTDPNTWRCISTNTDLFSSRTLLIYAICAK